MIDEQRFLELESIVKNMVKVGIVESFNQNNATARVVFEDANLKSYDLPIMVKQTKDNKDYWVPDIDEPVICIFLPTGIESGFILGAYYNQKDKPPVMDQNKRTVKFKDGTIIEYDRKQHKLTADVKGDINIKATGKIDVFAEGSITAITNSTATVKATGVALVESSASITLKAPTIALVTGGLTLNTDGGGASTMTLNGDITISGTTITGGSINLNTHYHKESIGDKTGGPLS